jgi:hypothetical protein
MREPISLARLLDALARLDEQGGASIEQVAWELDVEPERIGDAWRNALRDGLAQVTGDEAAAQTRARLTPGGWAALRDPGSALGSLA